MAPLYSYAMEFDTQQYFRDYVDDDAKGFTVIETDESVGYRIAEARDGKFAKPFWMSERELLARVQDGLAEPIGMVSSRQFKDLCEAVGIL